MVKGPHREAQRVILPNKMWLLLYKDGTIKLGAYHRTLSVTEVQNRNGSGHIFIDVHETSAPRDTQIRADDLVTIPRSTWNAINRGFRGS